MANTPPLPEETPTEAPTAWPSFTGEPGDYGMNEWKLRTTSSLLGITDLRTSGSMLHSSGGLTDPSATPQVNAADPRALFSPVTMVPGATPATVQQSPQPMMGISSGQQQQPHGGVVVVQQSAQTPQAYYAMNPLAYQQPQQQQQQQQPTDPSMFSSQQMIMANDEYNRGAAAPQQQHHQQKKRGAPSTGVAQQGPVAPASVFFKTEAGTPSARPQSQSQSQPSPQEMDDGTAIPANVLASGRQATQLLVAVTEAVRVQKQAIAAMRGTQRHCIQNQDINGCQQLAQQQSQINALFEDVEQKLSELERSQLLVPAELMMASTLDQELFIQHEQLRLYMAELQHRTSARQAPMPCIASLVITEQSFPLVLSKGKQIDDFPVCVRILSGAVQEYRQVDHFNPVLVADPQSKAPSQNIIEMDKEEAEGESVRVKLRVINGTRKIPVNMKMTTTVSYPSGTAVLESQPSRPFIVITNECQYEESDGSLLKRMAFGSSVEIPWVAFANHLQRHFMRATRQDFMAPERYLSARELNYLHTRFFACRMSIAAAQFDAFWGWFGKVLQKLRYTRHICGMWRNGLIWGFVEREEMVRLLVAQPPGSFVVRFSERHAGLFAVGYKVPADQPPDADTDPSAATVRHYLVKPEEISLQKTLADFLGEVHSFSTIVQVKYTDMEQDPDPSAPLPQPSFVLLQKDPALTQFYSKREQRNLQGYDVVLGAPGSAPLHRNAAPAAVPAVMPMSQQPQHPGFQQRSQFSPVGPYTPQQERPI